MYSTSPIDARCKLEMIPFSIFGVFPVFQRPWGKLCTGTGRGCRIFPSTFIIGDNPMERSIVFFSRSVPTPRNRTDKSAKSSISLVWYVRRAGGMDSGATYVLQKSFSSSAKPFPTNDMIFPTHNILMYHAPNLVGDLVGTDEWTWTFLVAAA